MSTALPPVCLIVSKYHSDVTTPLREAAEAAYAARGGDASSLGLIEAPGTYELVALAAAAADCGLYDAVCCLGCVVKGQTEHAEYINQAVATGLAQISIQSGVPVAFGVITAGSAGQARDRAGGSHGNKGTEAMEAVLDSLAAQEALADAAQADRPGFAFRLKRTPRKPGEN
ncbi:MAG: 6,7-dimethyl-8-ribityllumazine synthase [Planctomycetota bacterium]